MNLPDKRQEPYLYSVEEIEQNQERLAPEWECREQKLLSRTFTFPNFEKAAAFVQAMTKIAEELHHHPKIVLEWGKVTVELTTHSLKGISNFDFSLAEKLDAEYATFI